MLKYRLLVGIPMAAAVALLAIDTDRFHPGLLVIVGIVAGVAAMELGSLLAGFGRPRRGELAVGVLAVLTANWWGTLTAETPAPWAIPLAAAATAFLLAGTAEVVRYTGDRQAAGRMVVTAFALVYLGLLPAFLVRLRWLPEVGLWAVLATIFVPKVGDIGAYFSGRAVGRHKMAPTLSPKKTWEGFAGGLVAAAGTAVGIGCAAPLFPHGPLEAIAFGVVVGTAGVLGDLFESLLKRDARVKDAAATLPGFGGVLDVIDSVLFAAPVAYLWFTVRPL